MAEPADLLAQALAKLQTANRIDGSRASYRKDSPTEYDKVIAYLQGGSRPSGVTSDMGVGLTFAEDARRGLVIVEPPPPPPPPPPTSTPWPNYLNEISMVKHSSPPAPEIVYQPNGTVTLTCRDETPLLGSDRQLVAISLLGGAQAIEGRRCRYEWTQTFLPGWKGTTGEVNFFFECHTQSGQGAGQLSCGIGARCDYPLSHTTPGVNPTWFFRPIGPGGRPPLEEMIGPAIIVGTSYAMKVEVVWSSTAGEFDVFIDGVRLRNFNLPTFWPGDNLSLALYNYRWDTPHTASVNFSKPVVTVL